MTSHIGQEAGRTVSASSTKKAGRPLHVGIAAALLLSCSPLALHAETSNAELAKEIADLKAQIHELKGAISSTRTEVRKVKVVAAPAPYAPAFVPPPGSVPVFVTADKKMQFGALTITPGGFFAAEDVYRSRAQNRELESVATSVPFGPQSATNENRLSGRGSRAALLIESPISSNFLVSGYGEIDFQQVGVGSNYNQSSSFSPRIRHAYAALDNSDYGLHVLAGQTFSLATLSSKGITPRNEALTPTIDYNYVTGFFYKRQAQIRLVKDFNKKLWLAVSAENSGTAYQGCSAGVNGTAVNGTAVTCNYAGSGSLAGYNVGTAGAGDYNLSLNHVPDVVAKAAYEATFGDRDVHLEAFGLYRDITDRVDYSPAVTTQLGTAANYNKTAGGFGFGVIVPVIPKRLDFQGGGLIGRGVGSYGTGQIADAAFGADGSPLAIREDIFNGGFTLHATPSIDIYAFGGVETAHQSTQAVSAANIVGYGSPLANNSGCFNDVNGSAANACTGNTKRVFELTAGMWDKIYKGSFGEVRVGLQYAYQQRELFQGNGTSAVAAGGGNVPLAFAPKQNDQIVYTSLRYYPFQ